VYHDRAPDRRAEEARYAAYSEAPPLGDAAVAAAQWRWVERRRAGRGIRLLDIGCGHGAFLRAGRDGGCRVAGVELDPAGVAACRAAGLEVYAGSLFDVGAPAGPWDVITLWDVLDHLERPDEALRLLAAELAPGALLVVRVRNARLHGALRRLHRRFGARLGFRDLSVVHRWGFHRRALERLLAGAGLAEVRTHPAPPTPGDRFGSLGPGALSAAVKTAVRAAAATAFTLSAGRAYPYPSLLATGTRPRAADP